MAKAVERKCPRCGKTSAYRADQIACCKQPPKPPKPPKPELTESSTIDGDNWSISLPKTRIHTLEQLLEFCKVDLLVWEVERFICNKWEMGYKDKAGVPGVEPLYQIKAFLRRKKNIQRAVNEIEELRKKAEAFAPEYPKLPGVIQSGNNIAVEYALYDHHFGALIWGRETGHEDYDNNIAIRGWEGALGDLRARTSGFGAKRAVLVLGNDQQNADNRAGTTEHGTPQNMDSRYQKVFGISRDASIWAIDALLGEHGAVDVIMVPGNHDMLATWHLGDSLTAWYRRQPNVKVWNEPTLRKYYEYGANMLLFTHGNTSKLEKYGATMAAEKPEMWGRTKWREAHTGDKHQRRLIELPGATVRILPSLRPPCAWSSEQHYVGSIRAAEAYVWSKTEGLVGTAVHSILKKDQ